MNSFFKLEKQTQSRCGRQRKEGWARQPLNTMDQSGHGKVTNIPFKKRFKYLQEETKKSISFGRNFPWANLKTKWQHLYSNCYTVPPSPRPLTGEDTEKMKECRPLKRQRETSEPEFHFFWSDRERISDTQSLFAPPFSAVRSNKPSCANSRTV